MKISAINMPIYFNGTNKDYKKEVEEKSNTTLKLAIGTAIAGASLLGAYYITKGKKQPPKENSNIKNATETIKEKLETTTEIIDKTSKEIIDKLPGKVITTINGIKLKSEHFKERIISILDNGKTKVEYLGNENSKISKKSIYIKPDGEIQGSITNFSNGKTIIEKFKHSNTVDTRKKIFFDKYGNLRKTQILTTELQTSAKIPVGFKNTIEITERNQAPSIRTTEYTPDMKPIITNSNGNKIIYGYSHNKSGVIIGHAFTSSPNKYKLKFLNNPNFQKEFDSLDNIYSWSKGNFNRR